MGHGTRDRRVTAARPPRERQVGKLWDQAQLALSMFVQKSGGPSGARIDPRCGTTAAAAPAAGPGSSLPLGWGERRSMLPEDKLVAAGAILPPKPVG